MNRRKIAKRTVIAFIGLTAVAWIAGEVMVGMPIPAERYGGIILSQQADPILRRACFDCHSFETDYPWYSHLPYSSLLLGLDIYNGRDEVNFSRWDQIAKDRQSKKVESMMREIRSNGMPPLQYRLMHGDAKITAAELAILERAAKDAYGVTAVGVSTPPVLK